MNKHRKLALAVLASITIAGIAGASASSLGGLSSASIGSDDAITAACQTVGKIAVSYNTVYNTTSGSFDVGSVTFSNVNAACDGKTATVVLADSAKASIGNGTLTPIVLSSNAFTVDVTDASATAVERISLVIQG